MALIETIQQALADPNTPYVNGVWAGRKLSPLMLKNVFQDVIERDGLGTNQKWVSEGIANSVTQVVVNHVLPIVMKPREQGARKNGASFSKTQHFSATETVGIDILQIVDDPIIIPRARQDYIPVSLLAEQVENYDGNLATIINGACFASKVLATYTADEDERHVVDVDADFSGNYATSIVQCNTLLDGGDMAHGLDVFPSDSRICVMKKSVRTALKAAGVLILGGANYAYDIQRGSGVNPGVRVDSRKGYWGEIDGIPVYGISNQSLMHASGFLGLTDYDLVKSNLIGYVASAYANAFGLSAIEQIKVVDTLGGQGVELQPLTKLGAVSWYPLGNVMLTKGHFDPYSDLKEIFSAEKSEITFKLRGAGSRLYPSIVLGTVGTASTSVTATALDDAEIPSDHAVAGAYVVADKAYATVSEFLVAYKADGAVKGKLTSLVGANAIAVESGKYLTVLVIADDGSCSLASGVCA